MPDVDFRCDSLFGQASLRSGAVVPLLVPGDSPPAESKIQAAGFAADIEWQNPSCGAESSQRNGRGKRAKRAGWVVPTNSRNAASLTPRRIVAPRWACPRRCPTINCWFGARPIGSCFNTGPQRRSAQGAFVGNHPLPTSPTPWWRSESQSQKVVGSREQAKIPASCRLLPASCRLLPADCFLPPASCFLPPADC